MRIQSGTKKPCMSHKSILLFLVIRLLVHCSRRAFPNSPQLKGGFFCGAARCFRIVFRIRGHFAKPSNCMFKDVVVANIEDLSSASGAQRQFVLPKCCLNQIKLVIKWPQGEQSDLPVRRRVFLAPPARRDCRRRRPKIQVKVAQAHRG